MYRTIDAAFWTDPLVRSLDPLCKLLFLYLITNPHTHVSGIYYISMVAILHETGLSQKQCGYGIDTLSRSGFCEFDAEREIIWVKNMMRYQGDNDKTRISAKRHILDDLHNTPLIDHFLAAYPLVAKLIPDRVPIGYPEKSSRATPEQEQDIEQERESPLIPLRGKFENVRLADAQIDELNSRFGEAGASERIEALSEYIASKNRKYTNHYATILSWERKNGTHSPNGQPSERATTAGNGASRLKTRPYTPKQ